MASLENITDELAMWDSMFPGIKPTFCELIKYLRKGAATHSILDVGSNPLSEVMDHVRHLGPELHVRNKRDLALVRDAEAPVVFSAAAKLGSAIKAAAASGIQVLYVDSVGEMEKIKKFHPSARLELKTRSFSLFKHFLCVHVTYSRRLKLFVSGLLLNFLSMTLTTLRVWMQDQESK